MQDAVLGGGEISTSHARFNTVLEVDILVEVGRGPEVDELNFLVLAADTVDTTEALDDAHRVPVNVIVRQQVAILKVLPFGDTVSCNQDVDLAILRHGFHLRPLLGTR